MNSFQIGPAPATPDTLHRRVVGVAHPDARDKLRRVAHRQVVAKVVGRAGLDRGRAVASRSTELAPKEGVRASLSLSMSVSRKASTGLIDLLAGRPAGRVPPFLFADTSPCASVIF
jgi:hypothetical protein